MSSRNRHSSNDDLTRRYHAGDFSPPPEPAADAGEDAPASPDESTHDAAAADRERFGLRSKHHQKNKTARTAEQRAADKPDRFVRLPVGRVVQIFSLYIEVEETADDGQSVYLCTIRKTLARTSGTSIVVNDLVRVRRTGGTGTAVDGRKMPEGVIEQILPRRTVLTRAASFKGRDQHPVVANADRMLIVVAYAKPRPKWGLVDRMIVAARAGGLEPVVCVNKIDLEERAEGGGRGAEDEDGREVMTVDDLFDDLTRLAGGGDPDDPGDAVRRTIAVPGPREALAHYASMGILTVATSVDSGAGLDDLRDVLRGRTTVLAGHSGVGKSSLIRSIQPGIDLAGLRVGDVSGSSEKGMHTTTGGRRYPLDFGGEAASGVEEGAVIDTPGVKVFGLWDVTADALIAHFPDVAAGAAPPWRRASYERILESLTPSSA